MHACNGRVGGGHLQRLSACCAMSGSLHLVLSICFASWCGLVQPLGPNPLLITSCLCCRLPFGALHHASGPSSFARCMSGVPVRQAGLALRGGGPLPLLCAEAALRQVHRSCRPVGLQIRGAAVGWASGQRIECREWSPVFSLGVSAFCAKYHCAWIDLEGRHAVGMPSGFVSISYGQREHTVVKGRLLAMP